MYALDRNNSAGLGQEPNDASDMEWEDDRVVRCAACEHIIARAADAVKRDGRHEHVFTNPHGYTFRIALFAPAAGLRSIGEPTEEWSWFHGTAWSHGVCRACLAHIGWTYHGEGERFGGLITARILR